MTINAWIACIAGGFYLLLLGAFAVLLVINANQRATIAAAEVANALLRAQNKEWAAKTAATNSAIAKLRAAEAANAKNIAKAQATARVAGEKLRDQAAAIAAFEFTGGDCDGVEALRKTYLENLR